MARVFMYVEYKLPWYWSCGAIVDMYYISMDNLYFVQKLWLLAENEWQSKQLNNLFM